MSKRELSIVELQQLFEGNKLVSINGSIMNIYLDGHYIGIPTQGLYLLEEQDDVIDLKNSKFWLSYFRGRDKFHLTIF